MPAWPVAPPKIGGCSPLHARPPKGAAHWRAERCFFRGACPRKKRILVGSAGCGRRKSATLALPGESVGTERPADVCGACPTGRVRWVGRAGGCLRVCPAGRVCWVGKAGGCLRGVPFRASPLRRKGQRMSMGCALPGESVGSERPADTCGPVRWVGEASGSLRRFLGPLWEWFSCSGPMFSFWGKFFWKLPAHLAGLIRYTG